MAKVTGDGRGDVMLGLLPPFSPPSVSRSKIASIYFVAGAAAEHPPV